MRTRERGVGAVNGEAQHDRSAGSATSKLGAAIGESAPRVAPAADPLALISAVAQCLRDGPDLDANVERALGAVREHLRLHAVQLVPMDGRDILGAGRTPVTEGSLRERAKRVREASGEPILDSGPGHAAVWLL